MKLLTLIISIALLFSSLIFLGCNDNKIIPEEKFIEVYVDLMIVQDTTSNQLSPDSVRSIVFNKHNVTENEYENTIESYHTNPDKWEEFFNKAIKYVEKLRSESAN